MCRYLVQWQANGIDESHLHFREVILLIAIHHGLKWDYRTKMNVSHTLRLTFHQWLLTEIKNFKTILSSL